MTTIAIYPGSFDPVTHGHADLIERAVRFADRVVVAVARNPAKEPLFTLEERVSLLRQVTKEIDGPIEIEAFDGLLADFARRRKARIIIRGLRAVSDFDFESQMALMNRQLHPELETIFLVPAVHLTYLSSSLVREVARFGGDVRDFVHPTVDEALRAKFHT